MCDNARTIYQGAMDGLPLSVAEEFDQTESALILSMPDAEIRLVKYTYSQLAPRQIPEGRRYYGYTQAQVAASGRDLLGERALANGEIGWPSVEGVLPPLTNGAYAMMGSHVGWSGVVVDINGDLRSQRNHATEPPRYVLRPSEVDPALGALTPVRLLLDGDMPIVLSVHRDEAQTLELMHFIEPGDPGKDPAVWTRALTYDNRSKSAIRERLLLSGLDLMTEGREPVDAEPDMFWDAFAIAARYWRRYRESFARLNLPDGKLTRAVYGCLGSMAITYSGDHPHYGHEFYGWEIHDHFPPTSITALEACAVLGNAAYARRLVEHLLAYAIDEAGRFYYRQGEACQNGAAGSEYGQLLWLIDRYEPTLSPDGTLMGEYAHALKAIGDMLIRNRLPSATHPDLRLIRMCAEADTNGRVYDYMQNSFWAARGLTALARLLARRGLDGGRFQAEADALLADAREAVARSRVETAFGPIPPFQLDYTATPQTLSNCRDTFAPLSDDEYASYLSAADFRKPLAGGQNYVENTYANYRYYLEMLSSRCLAPEEEQALVNLRERLGGELLGMTRFMDRLDDWPVYNYARYLLETGRVDKYRLLLYAHTELHGLPDLMTYYEQAGIEGSVIAPDCVPSLLTTPLMVAWMLAFEPVQADELWLLRGVPTDWFAKGFRAEGLMTRWGRVSVCATPDDDGVDVLIALPGIPRDIPVAAFGPGGARRAIQPGTREVRLRFSL